MAGRLCVLVMDDSIIVLNMMVLALTEAGFEVIAASSILEFEELMRKNKPHIVLTDIQMPDISGDNICRVLKQKMDTQFTPIILFSTIDVDELAALAERSGADGFVSKNAGVEEIVKKINELTEEIVF